MIRNFHQSKRKKIRPPIGNLDPEIMKEFDKQVSDNLEIENRRKKQLRNFWMIAFFSGLIITAGIVALLFFVKW